MTDVEVLPNADRLFKRFRNLLHLNNQIRDVCHILYKLKKIRFIQAFALNFFFLLDVRTRQALYESRTT